MDREKSKATERSEGGSDKRTTRARATHYPHQLVLRLDAETYAALEQHAKENNRTVAQTARGWLWRGRTMEDAATELCRLERETFEESP
jgi:hypothetical protein